MSTPISYFRQYINRVSGRRAASERLGIGIAQISHIMCDRRGISPQVAMAIDADTNGEIRKGWLRPDLWKEDSVGEGEGV